MRFLQRFKAWFSTAAATEPTARAPTISFFRDPLAKKGYSLVVIEGETWTLHKRARMTHPNVSSILANVIEEHVRSLSDPPIIDRTAAQEEAIVHNKLIDLIRTRM